MCLYVADNMTGFIVYWGKGGKGGGGGGHDILLCR